MNRRVYGLDIVRAVAILTVVYMHAILNLGIPALLRYSIGDGVSIFFVLSGFLIGKILLNTI
ncbi:MAG TPA: acyltransferase family protein, partial [Parafilimonas sp.]|nr:acyltransferase family protein [Parafilimonas sp.]